MDKIEVHGRKVYYWGMTNMTTPSQEGVRSGVIYYEADCKRGRYKTLTRAFYSRSMAQGNPKIINENSNLNNLYINIASKVIKKSAF